ncbi:hypothetical protein Y1Q_0022600 [Alligator mississippiensis]|uniref:Uncharacterized protein n=1 Tax=Alligator mississippiensis TaxID=8496 RepID=A0A151NQA4_ALLMI|nr:hypothetical protein Y1Q_0022600 [Alligator mississippiensis]
MIASNFMCVMDGTGDDKSWQLLARANENRLAQRDGKVRRLLRGDRGSGRGKNSGRKLNNSLKFPGERDKR